MWGGFYTDHRRFAPSTLGSSDLGASKPLNGSQVDAKGLTIYGLEINLHSVYTKTSLCKTVKLV